jgi:ribonucleotide reductase beta subunit family protein with ferritin-like domain
MDPINIIPNLTKGKKYAYFPIEHPLLESYADKQQRLFWTSEDIDFLGDRDEWDDLDNDTRKYLTFLIFLFAQFDGIVNENIIKNFQEDTSDIDAASIFYRIQAAIEDVHGKVYSLFIKAFIRSIDEQNRGLNSIEYVPEVRNMAAWVFKWMNRDIPLMERIIAFACVEGIMFSSAFTGIYWIKRRNILKALTKANEFIARDEAIHTEFAVALFHTYASSPLGLKKHDAPSKERVIEIISSSVNETVKFTRNAMNIGLVGLSCDDMTKYIQCTGDSLCESLGYGSIYNAVNPLTWMAIISLPNKTNFFESRVSEYSKQKESNFEYDFSDKVIF